MYSAAQKIAFSLGWQDIRQAYRRSAVGPYWMTIGMAVQISTMGLVFGIIFKADLEDYLPFLATSIIFWGFISSSINEGCMSFIASEAMIKQLDIPHFVYVLRTLWRNILATLHNLVILPLVFLLFWKSPDWTILAFIPGFAILILNLGWVVWLAGMLSARFRDTPPIIGSLTTIAFYVTPVMWFPKLIENNSLAHLLLGLNPIYHWLQIVRLPILGQWPTLENLGLALLSAGFGWAVTILLYTKYKKMIAYWV